MRVVGRNAGLLALAIVGTLASATIWVPVVFLIVDTFPESPAFAGAILSIILAVFFVCLRGAGTRPRAISIASRAVLLFLSVVAAIVSMEAISFGFIGATVTQSRDGYLWMAIAIALVALAAWGTKAALDWRLSFWILFPAVFSTLIVATFGISILSVL